MANYCDFQMKIVGERENVQTLVNYLQANYHYQNGYSNCTADKHFFGVLTADIVKEQPMVSGDYLMMIQGECEWSVRCSMFEGEHTYYNRWTPKRRSELKESFRGTHLEEITKLLNLKIEIHSQEKHCGFHEHYIIEAGHVFTETFESLHFYCEDEDDLLEMKFAV